MNSTTLSDLAAAVRDACFGAAIDAYEDAGAAAISVLTEPDYFWGSLDDLRAARGATAPRTSP